MEESFYQQLRQKLGDVQLSSGSLASAPAKGSTWCTDVHTPLPPHPEPLKQMPCSAIGQALKRSSLVMVAQSIPLSGCSIYYPLAKKKSYSIYLLKVMGEGSGLIGQLPPFISP